MTADDYRYPPVEPAKRYLYILGYLPMVLLLISYLKPSLYCSSEQSYEIWLVERCLRISLSKHNLERRTKICRPNKCEFCVIAQNANYYGWD